MDTHPDPLREGVRLFNDGHYWHAHEEWEQCWRGAREPEATLYKGIIQTAAALVHWQRQNPRGLRRNWAKARPKLVATLPLRDRLAIERLIAEMDQFVMAAGHAAPPRIRLPETAGADPQ